MIDMHAPRRLQRSTVVLCGILVFSYSVSVHADESETLKHRFFEEAPRSWQEYGVYAERLQGTTETTVTIKGKVRSRTRVEYKSNPRCRMVSSQSLIAGDSPGEVLAFNPLYGFNLKQKANKAPWILADLQVGKMRLGPKGWDDFPALRLCISTQLYELPELIRLPNFRVVRASATQHGGIELCQINFESKQTDGVLLLDPNRFWTLHHSTIRDKSSNDIISARQDIELRDPAAKYPIPKYWLLDKEIVNPKDGKRGAQVIREFDLKELSHAPDDKEFTLSAFGLPEPMGAEPLPPSRTWLWLLAAAMVAVALAILFAWLKRRHTKMASRSSTAS